MKNLARAFERGAAALTSTMARLLEQPGIRMLAPWRCLSRLK
jgi:hypothetical protein